MRGISKNILIIVSVTLLVISYSSVGIAGSVFGPNTYSRTAGASNSYSDSFTSILGEGKIIITNGDEDGSHRASSATILINGNKVVGPNNFNQQVYKFDRQVTLEEQNTISVVLNSAPDSYLNVEVVLGWTLRIYPNSYATASHPTDDQEIISIFIANDESGNPYSIPGFIMFDPKEPSKFDSVDFGGDALPDKVILRDGSSLFFEYLPDSKVKMIVSFPDGEPVEIIFDFDHEAFLAGEATKKPEAQLQSNPTVLAASSKLEMTSALSNCDMRKVYINVDAETCEENEYVNDALVNGSWQLIDDDVVFDPSTGGAFTASLTSEGNGVYSANIPMIIDYDPSATQEFCGAYVDLFDGFCEVQGGQTVTETAYASCGALLYLGPQAVAICELLVLTSEVACVNEYFCTELIREEYQFLGSNKPMNVTVLVSATVNDKYYIETKSQQFEPPIDSNLIFDFTTPLDDPSSCEEVPDGRYLMTFDNMSPGGCDISSEYCRSSVDGNSITFCRAIGSFDDYFFSATQYNEFTTRNFYGSFSSNWMTVSGHIFRRDNDSGEIYCSYDFTGTKSE